MLRIFKFKGKQAVCSKRTLARTGWVGFKQLSGFCVFAVAKMLLENRRKSATFVA